MRAGRWNFTAGVRGELMWSDNIRLAPPGQEASDAVIALSVPLGIRRAGPRSLLRADYIPTAYGYAQNSDANYVQHNLRSFASLEAVQDFLFVDAVANIYPFYVSPFLPRPDSGASITGNRSQRTTLGLNPYIRHQTVQGWSYLVRNDNVWNAYTDANLADTSANRITTTVESPPSRMSFGLDYTYLYTRDQAQPTGYYQQWALVRPTVRATRTLSLSARAGYESNDYLIPEYSGGVYGAGLVWTPNPRTRLDGFLERRFFGAAYDMNLSYRTRRTVLRLRGFRGTVTPLDQPFTQRPATTAEVLDDAYRSRISDPTEREREVRRFLDTSGLPPSLVQTYSFYAPTIYVSKQWNASLAFVGRRNTADLTVFWQDNEPITTGGNLASSAFAYDPFRQFGVTLNVSHRLSGLTSVAFSAIRAETKRTAPGATSAGDFVQKTARIGLTHRLGLKTDASVAFRWSDFDSVVTPYRERAVLAALAHSF
jgi:uncharacterized protein (PEP-CTERM system associated)